MALVILERSSCMVVSGKVIEITGEAVSIVETVHLPISGKEEERIVRMRFRKNEEKRWGWAKIGASVMACTSYHPSLAALRAGGETNEKVYDVWLYAMRYTGSFDFAEKEGEKEAHVFCGSVLDATAEKVLLSYTANEKKITRHLFAGKNIKLPSVERYARHIFVTGGPTQNRQFPILAAY